MSEKTSASEPPTLELVEAARAGSSDARERLFTRYLPRVRRIVALRMRWAVKDLDRLEDVVQESLLKAVTSFDSFKECPEGTFRNWMARCVQSAIVDHLRRDGAKKRGGGKVKRFADLRPESLASSIFASEAPSPSTVIANQEEEARLQAALLQLAEHYREAIVLVKLCGMSYAEAANAMGFRSPGSVGQVIHRAIRKLQEIMGTMK